MQYTFEGHETPVYSVCPHSKESIQVSQPLKISFVTSTLMLDHLTCWFGFFFPYCFIVWYWKSQSQATLSRIIYINVHYAVYLLYCHWWENQSMAIWLSGIQGWLWCSWALVHNNGIQCRWNKVNFVKWTNVGIIWNISMLCNKVQLACDGLRSCYQYFLPSSFFLCPWACIYVYVIDAWKFETFVW